MLRKAKLTSTTKHSSNYLNVGTAEDLDALAFNDKPANTSMVTSLVVKAKQSVVLRIANTRNVLNVETHLCANSGHVHILIQNVCSS